MLAADAPGRNPVPNSKVLAIVSGEGGLVGGIKPGLKSFPILTSLFRQAKVFLQPLRMDGIGKIH
jgi:hypothetical protein